MCPVLMNVAINKQVCYQSSAADRLPGLSHGLLIFEDPAGDELCDASGHALKNKNVKIRVRLELYKQFMIFCSFFFIYFLFFSRPSADR